MQDRPEAPAHSFVDVVVVEQQQPVAWMVSEGVTTGTSDTTFSPNRELTRVEVAAFLWRLADRPDAVAHSFVDVLSGWQQGPVSWMASTSITTGTSPIMFSPDGTLPALRVSGRSEGVEQRPVGFPGVEQGSDAVVVEVGEPERGAFDAFG